MDGIFDVEEVDDEDQDQEDEEEEWDEECEEQVEPEEDEDEWEYEEEDALQVPLEGGAELQEEEASWEWEYFEEEPQSAKSVLRQEEVAIQEDRGEGDVSFAIESKLQERLKEIKAKPKQLPQSSHQFRSVRNKTPKVVAAETVLPKV